MSIADNTLKKLQTNDIFVDVYTDHFDESLYGFICNFNDDFLLLEHYNDDGFYDGVIILRRDDITRLRWGNNNVNSVSDLVSRQRPAELNDIDINSTLDILRTVQASFGHVNIHLQNVGSDWCLIGEVEQMDEETLVVKEFGTMSSLDRGMLMVSTDDVTRIDADGIYEKNLMMIHKKTIN